MNLAEKMKHLREVEGELRGYNRSMTQMEVVKAMQEELGKSISQAYLSQLESAKRPHLTASSRDLLARFFKVHPGYLVSDPPDFSTDLLTDMENDERHMETWLLASASEWRSEPALSELLQGLGEAEEPRSYIESFQRLLSLTPADLKTIADTLLSRRETPVE